MQNGKIRAIFLIPSIQQKNQFFARLKKYFSYSLAIALTMKLMKINLLEEFKKKFIRFSAILEISL
jgi:primosomal protein N'